MLARLRREEGNVLVIAVVMTMLMLTLGTVALSTVDTQTDVTKRERQHESSFNLAEGVLNAQGFVLGRLGTGNPSTGEFPDECTQATVHSLCPTQQQVALSYTALTQNDYDAATTWKTEVHDNPVVSGASITYYDSDLVASAPQYDANDDDQLWVRAEATVRGRTRQIVALIRVETRPVTFPSYAVLSGGFATSNNGTKVIVDVTDPTSLGVAVRCEDPGAPDPNSDCLGYNEDKGQLDPPGHYLTGVADTPAVSLDNLQALEEVAKGNGTYYSTCGSNTPDPNGAIVVVEAGNCSYTAAAPKAPGQSRCCNSALKPGVFIIKCGTMTIGGNIEFHGIIYSPNKASPPDGPWCSDTAEDGNVITTQGTSAILGGAIVDGPGRVFAGSSGSNIIFDPKAFENVRAAGTAGVVQNTWREVPDDN